MHTIVDGKATSDGCPVVATMFVDIVANQCDKTVDLYNAGFEIADHTLHHIDVSASAVDLVPPALALTTPQPFLTGQKGLRSR